MVVDAPRDPNIRMSPSDLPASCPRAPRGAQRLLDVAVACVAVVVLSPLLVGRAVAGLIRERRLFDHRVCTGVEGERFQRLRFAGDLPLAGIAVLWNLLRGEIALVGPRPLSPEEAETLPAAAMARFRVPPGLISAYAVRQQVGIAYADEYSQDVDYVDQAALINDLGLLFRGLAGWLLSVKGQPLAQPDAVNIFGVRMDNLTMSEALDWIIAASAPGKVPSQLAFVNPDCLNIAWRDPDYKARLLACERVLPDGIGLRIGGRMLGLELRDNVNGTDMFPLLCEAAAGAGRSLYLLGSRSGIAAAAGEAMRERFPDLVIAGVRDGYFTASEEDEVVDQINQSGSAILLVALGAPQQEQWIARHRERLAPPVAMGVGGLFDFYSGRIRRAPQWMREIGLEWVYRLLQEPGRMWRRYIIGNPVFLYRVWLQKRRPERFQLPAGDDDSPDAQSSTKEQR